MSPALSLTDSQTFGPAATAVVEQQLAPTISNNLAHFNHDLERASSALNTELTQEIATASPNIIIKLLSEIAASHALPPEQIVAIELAQKHILESSKDLEMLVLSFLAATDLSGISDIHSINPADRQRMELLLAELLENAKDEDLLNLVEDLGIAPQNELLNQPRSREELIATLKQARLVELCTTNPEILRDIAVIISSLSILTPEAKAAIDSAIANFDGSLKNAVELLSQEIILLAIVKIRQEIKRNFTSYKNHLDQPDASFKPRTKDQPLELNVEAFLRWLKLQHEIFDSSSHTDWKKIAEIALREQDKKLRERNETAELQAEAQTDRHKKALDYLVDKIVRQNPGLIGTIAEISLRQENFLGLFAKPVPAFTGY